MECGTAAAIILVVGLIYYWAIRARNAELERQRASEQHARDAEAREKRDRARRERARRKRAREDLWAAWYGYEQCCPEDYEALRAASKEAWDKVRHDDDVQRKAAEAAAQVISDAHDAQVLAWFRKQTSEDQEIWRLEEQARDARRLKAARERYSQGEWSREQLEREIARAVEGTELEADDVCAWLDAVDRRLRQLADGLETDLDIYFGFGPNHYIQLGREDSQMISPLALLRRRLDRRDNTRTATTPAEVLEEGMEREAAAMVEEHVRSAIIRRLGYDPWA